MSAARKRCAGERECNPEREVRRFEAGDVDPREFDHEAHVRVAWSYLKRYPAALAILKFTSALRALTIRLGASDKYHETISWFFMLVIAERLAACPDADWGGFKSANRDLFEGASLLKRYYSKSRLDSAAARLHFLLPDVAPDT